MMDALTLASLARTSRVLAHAANPHILAQGRGKALAQGSAGVDGQTAEAFREAWPDIRPKAIDGLTGGWITFAPYKGIRIPKAGGAPRRGCCPTRTDHAATWALAHGLYTIHLARLQHDCVYAATHGRSAFLAVRRLWVRSHQSPIFVSCDIRRFFESIDRTAVLQELGAATGDPALGEVLARRYETGVQRHGRVVPVSGLAFGEPLSPCLANFALHREDPGHAALAPVHVRYLDDLAWLCETRAQADALPAAVTASLAARGLTVKPASLQVRDLRVFSADYLGWRLTPTRLEIAPDRLAAFTAALTDVREQYFGSWETAIGVQRCLDLLRGAIEAFHFAANVSELYDLARRARGWFPDPSAWHSLFQRQRGHLGSLQGVYR